MCRIYVMTHKKCEIPENKLYSVMQVGSALHDDLGYLRDDTGDNISEKNPYYSELTGMYWVWKNDHESTVTGICHYRRYLLNERGSILGTSDILNLLKNYDIITTKLLTLNYSYYEAFGADHNRADLDITADIIRSDYPEYYEDYYRTVNDVHSYFGNMIICRKDLYDRYCAWLFDILFKAEKRVDMSGYNDYQKRLYGFLSELLLSVYIRHHGLNVKECMVGMLGEKKETIEIRQHISEYIRHKDPAGGERYMIKCLKMRPDILMEASDIHGDLKLCMQILAVAVQEQDSHPEHTMLDNDSDLYSLMSKFRKLNTLVAADCARHYKQDTAESLSDSEHEIEAFLRDNHLSHEAEEISRKLILARDFSKDS